MSSEPSNTDFDDRDVNNDDLFTAPPIAASLGESLGGLDGYDEPQGLSKRGMFTIVFVTVVAAITIILSVGMIVDGKSIW